MQLHGRYDSQKCQLPPWEIIVRTYPPSLSPLLIAGRTFQKLNNLGGQNCLLESGDKPEIGGFDTFYTTLPFSSVTFTLCGGKVRFPLSLFGSSVFWVSYARFSSTFSFKSCTKIWYHLSILIHLTLFNLVWNAQKSILHKNCFRVPRQGVS